MFSVHMLYSHTSLRLCFMVLKATTKIKEVISSVILEGLWLHCWHLTRHHKDMVTHFCYIYREPYEEINSMEM